MTEIEPQFTFSVENALSTKPSISILRDIIFATPFAIEVIFSTLLPTNQLRFLQLFCAIYLQYAQQVPVI